VGVFDFALLVALGVLLDTREGCPYSFMDDYPRGNEVVAVAKKMG